MPVELKGSTSGGITLTATAVAGTNTLTLPAATGTLIYGTQPTGTIVGTTDTQTLTNKTLTSPTLTTPNIDSAQVPTVSGSAPLYLARAWVNFNGTGTIAIRASGNVTSLTDNGVGDYTINFTTAMADANYAIMGAVFENAGNQSRSFGGATGYSLAAGSARISTNSTAGFADYTVVAAAAFR